MADGQTHFEASELPERLRGVDLAFPGAVAKAAGTEPYFTGWYPEEYRAPTDLPRGYRPGERMLHGKPINFDLGLTVAFEVDQRVEAAAAEIDAGADVATWDYERLSFLEGDCINRSWRRKPRCPDPLGDRVFKLIANEKARRPQHIRAYGSRQVAA